MYYDVIVAIFPPDRVPDEDCQGFRMTVMWAGDRLEMENSILVSLIIVSTRVPILRYDPTFWRSTKRLVCVIIFLCDSSAINFLKTIASEAPRQPLGSTGPLAFTFLFTLRCFPGVN